MKANLPGLIVMFGGDKMTVTESVSEGGGRKKICFGLTVSFGQYHEDLT